MANQNRNTPHLTGKAKEESAVRTDPNVSTPAASAPSKPDVREELRYASKSFGEMHPADMPAAEAHAAKIAKLNEALEKNVKNGATREAEQVKMEKVASKVELASLSAAEFLNKQAQVAAEFETLGVVQGLEVWAGLLSGSGLAGTDYALGKIGSAIKHLKTSNGIPLNERDEAADR